MPPAYKSEADKVRRLGQKRTKGQREQDLVLTTQMYLRGAPLQQITDEIIKDRDYTLSVSTIHNDLKEIRKRWREAYLVDFNEAQVKELAKLDGLEAAYWEAWEDSKKAKDIYEKEKVEHKGTDKTGRVTQTNIKEVTKAKKEQRDPRAVYLQGVQWCIDQRCKILGLYAPATVNINWRKKAEEEGYDPEKIIDGLVREIIESDHRPQALLGGDGRSRSLGESPAHPE